MNVWLAGLLKTLVELLVQDFYGYLKDQWAKVVRSNKQADTAKAVSADQGKARDEQVKKDELSDINS